MVLVTIALVLVLRIAAPGLATILFRTLSTTLIVLGLVLLSCIRAGSSRP